MSEFRAQDGTWLAYHEFGEGPPLVCLPGGPMQAAEYLGDLGGAVRGRRLVTLDLRGTGESQVPADPATYRVDRQVGDVEALRVALGVDRLDLMGHSAGTTLAQLYAARHPERISSLVLLNVVPRAIGTDITDADRRQAASGQAGKPWFAPAWAAFEAIWAGDHSPENWEQLQPFVYGRWDAEIQELIRLEAHRKNQDAARAYYGPDAFDPARVRAALGSVGAPVLIVVGEHDVQFPVARIGEQAAVFAHAEVAIVPDGGHFAWLDDPQWLADRLNAFL